MKHTIIFPVSYVSDDEGFAIKDAEGRYFVGAIDSEENAAYIEKAVNNHDELVKSINDILYQVVNYSAYNGLTNDLLDAVSSAQALIKQVEEE